LPLNICEYVIATLSNSDVHYNKIRYSNSNLPKKSNHRRLINKKEMHV